MSKTVLAIDPGSSKCGMALAQRDADGNLKLLWRAVSPREDLIDNVKRAGCVEPFSLVIVGSGTTSKQVIHELRENLPSIGILVVDEKNTSLQARERYWEHNPRRGLRRLVPATMQVPPEPVDDFVAFILAERVLSDGS
jgi:RNase H-fold protein (predicted Holliday junction resolvase)